MVKAVLTGEEKGVRVLSTVIPTLIRALIHSTQHIQIKRDGGEEEPKVSRNKLKATGEGESDTDGGTITAMSFQRTRGSFTRDSRRTACSHLVLLILRLRTAPASI